MVYFFQFMSEQNIFILAIERMEEGKAVSDAKY
jgi:hypothetical protein